MAIERKAQDKFGRVGVLMGGPSSEREISLKSGQAVHQALAQSGLEAVAIDIKTDDIAENISLLKSSRIDCAFLALHGRFGEDGQIQEILDGLEIPYTGSGAKASRLAMDKVAARRIFQDNGLSVPACNVLEWDTYRQGRRITNNLSLPLVVKPATHGSSIGLSMVDTKKGLEKAVDLAFTFDRRVIIEEYIKGREVTVGILDERPLPVVEIVTKRRFFDYEAKYQAGMTEYIVPAELDKEVAQKLQATALSAHRFLGCAGCSRADIILNNDNIAYILELNTIPGMTQTSLLPKAARTVGIDFTRLCLGLIELAYASR